MGFRVWGLGFRAWGLGFGVRGFGFRLPRPGSAWAVEVECVQATRVQGSGFRL